MPRIIKGRANKHRSFKKNQAVHFDTGSGEGMGLLSRFHERGERTQRCVQHRIQCDTPAIYARLPFQITLGNKGIQKGIDPIAGRLQLLHLCTTVRLAQLGQKPPQLARAVPVSPLC